jgi:hypothetical protein
MKGSVSKLYMNNSETGKTKKLILSKNNRKFIGHYLHHPVVQLELLYLEGDELSRHDP